MLSGTGLYRFSGTFRRFCQSFHDSNKLSDHLGAGKLFLQRESLKACKIKCFKNDDFFNKTYPRIKRSTIVEVRLRIRLILQVIFISELLPKKK